MDTTVTAQVEELILASYESMYRLAYSYVRNQDDAMDIVQESAYKAIKSAGALRHPENLKTWLWRIVINASLDFLRKKKNEPACQEFSEPAAEDTYTDFDTLEALNILDEREKAVVVLRFFEDQKLEDIARILNENTNTVKTVLYRSLKKLKVRLAEGEMLYEG